MYGENGIGRMVLPRCHWAWSRVAVHGELVARDVDRAAILGARGEEMRAMRWDFADLDKLDEEYGRDPNDCALCGGKGGCHRALTRYDGVTVRCAVGDIRELTRRLHRLYIQYEECAHCKASLEPSTSPPHCPGCEVEDEEAEEWDATVCN